MSTEPEKREEFTWNEAGKKSIDRIWKEKVAPAVEKLIIRKSKYRRWHK